MAQLAPMMQLRARFEDKCGHPLAGGSVFAFEVGTSTPKATFADAAGTIPNSHPIKLDYRGEADIFLLTGRYRFVVYSCTGVKIYDVDNVGEWLGQVTADNVIDGDKTQHQINIEQAEKNASLSQEIIDAVEAEENRAVLAETNLTNLIDTEEDRASAAEASLDTKINTEISRATGVEASLQSQVNALGVGNRAYKTYAEMDADKANIPAKSKVTVTNDSTPSNNGDWQWDGTTFTKSTYDPLTQAKTYTDDSLRTLEANRTQNPNKLTYDQVLFNTLPTSTTGTATVVVRNGIKQLKLVSASTGGSIIAYWELPSTAFQREFSGSICIEGLTAGKDGLVGIQQLNASNTLISSTYALTTATAAITKQTLKVNVSGISAGATKIRLIVNMQTDTTREMYLNSPFLADGMNAEFIAPVDSRNDDLLFSAFNTVLDSKNKFNPALAEDGKTVQYTNGAAVTFANGVVVGKQAVVAGMSYTFWMPTSSVFSFFPVIYTYDKDGVYLGIDHSIPSTGEVVNPNPPTNIGYEDSFRTVKFTIPSDSQIRFIQLRTEYRTHTSTEFTTLINSMQLEFGSTKTAFVPYNPSASKVLILKETALPTTDNGGSTVVSTGNTFTLYLDGTYAYIRTGFSASVDLVQKVQYGTNDKWKNNVINPYEIKTIPKSTAKESLIAAYSTGTLVVSHPDDAAPLRYNGTYIGANHGALIAHQSTMSAHGKQYTDVGSIWTVDGENYTLCRMVDSNALWLVSANKGASSAKWAFSTTSLAGKTLTHVSGATNTANIVVSADSIVQLYSAVNNHVKKIIVDDFKTVSEVGFYDVETVEFVDSYNIMNPPAILSYLQSHTGTPTEQDFNVSSIDYDVNVQVSYRYALNGSVTINSQYQKKSDINFEFAGLTQALPLEYTGKTLLQYAPKMNPVTVGSNTYNLTGTVDITSLTDTINLLKANWADATNPPDRMAQIVRNGSTKEYGHVVGYSLTRGDTKPSIRQNTNDAGFIYTSRKMYPKALVTNLDSVVNTIAYRSIFNPNTLPQATVYTWFKDNNDIYVVFDIHQGATMLKLPLEPIFNGKNATVIDSHANFTLHSEIVSDGGLLCSVAGGYGQATIKLN
ncbi:hypothetical protein [Acinetobacter baumannii]|uniref:hypothetical protein n=1 Tax=Acinetobacter baumannii TaxID=470 RepID=UPI00385995BE